MKQLPVSVLWLFPAAAVGLTGGFLAGKRDGARSSYVHQALTTALRNELNEAEQTIRELEQRQSEHEIPMHLPFHPPMVAPDSMADSGLEVEMEGFPGPPYLPPVITDAGPLSTMQRIEELECEIASLREIIRQPQPFMGLTSAPQQQPKVSLSRCNAVTQKGSRCTRTARAGGKCWQHGG